ncbi:LysR family transcriptional regulator [Cupriavidus plantarum]|uniref:DNA-binding transcriptional LysR family regulator n=1 Tax=Cupriavidus plantarum TaxID=942865 RepID=A0A316EMM0_9BURK|nr:LysR family transcriptional regulator [Cupriavidus plantarum]NYI02703.1 DNA-binding transcriptional LysR family regulator [Cupriavidus plantarum]PWK30974.1 DNA-binding transcriptional LysR family regulator [Cupriavidus plantarum]REE85257.1 DNA-binding transcriptional LysR family regulator [Cupriavidus plantarum]RLK28549.1 DNA-binding transcriptional LysR family regulator [Cupriavidus plantarum]CAG2153769.1 HTH-type transcriptional regulator HdfR [Cupriavidus plantarum]
MNLKFIETFVWVARLRSFSLAADKLFTTQASVSSRISALERELDVRLLERNSKTVRLTAAGLRVLAEAEAVSESVERLRTALRADENASGVVRIGAMETVVHTWLAEMVAAVTRRHPKLEVELVVDTALRLHTLLREGQIDIALHTDLTHESGIASTALLSHPLAWIAAPNLPETARDRIITFSRHSRPYQDLAQLLREHGMARARLNGINSVAAMVRLLIGGFGVGVVPPAIVEEPLARGELVVLDAPMPQPPALPVTASWRTDIGFQATQRILDLIDTTVEEYAARVGPERAVLAAR